MKEEERWECKLEEEEEEGVWSRQQQAGRGGRGGGQTQGGSDEGMEMEGVQGLSGEPWEEEE